MMRLMNLRTALRSRSTIAVDQRMCQKLLSEKDDRTQHSPLDRVAHRVYCGALHVRQVKPSCVAMSDQQLVEALNCGLYIPLVCSAHARVSSVTARHFPYLRANTCQTSISAMHKDSQLSITCFWPSVVACSWLSLRASRALCAWFRANSLSPASATD